jgi:hypothetical protein
MCSRASPSRNRAGRSLVSRYELENKLLPCTASTRTGAWSSRSRRIPPPSVPQGLTRRMSAGEQKTKQNSITSVCLIESSSDAFLISHVTWNDGKSSLVLQLQHRRDRVSLPSCLHSSTWGAEGGSSDVTCLQSHPTLRFINIYITLPLLR